jgi:heme/copper-type cytochrome/quinol oxidase subunit 2
MDGGERPVGARNPYAPPQTPIEDGAAPLARQIEVAKFKSVRGLANAIAVVLTVEAVVELAVVLSGLVSIGVMARLVAGNPADRIRLAVRTGSLAGLGALLSLAVVVLFCLFMPRANRNARSFGAPLSNSPGWAAGWFFIPIAMWWKPYYAMKEIWQGSDPDPAVPPPEAKVPALLPLWWWTFVLRTLGGFVTNRMRGPNPADLMTAIQSQLVWFVPSIGSAILAGLVVRALARRQDERQRRELAGAPSASLE